MILRLHASKTPCRCECRARPSGHPTFSQMMPSHEKPLWSAITHRRITVATHLWTKDMEPPGNVKLMGKPNPAPPATPAPATRRPASARASIGGGGGSTTEETPGQRVKQRQTTSADFVPVPSWPPTRASRKGGLHKPHALVGHSRSNSPDGFEPIGEAAGAGIRLRWSDPLLMRGEVLEMGRDRDLEMLQMHEDPMVASRARREECLGALRAHLRAQQEGRDLVRAVRGAGRLDVQRRFVSKARVALAKLLAELRLCTAAVVLTTHAWRVELGELGRRRQWPAHARLALLRRADREVRQAPLMATDR